MATSTKTKLIDPGPIEFDAVLEQDEQAGAACYVYFKPDLKATFGKGNLVPIVATFDGEAEYIGSLAKMGGEHAVLVVTKDALAKIGKGKGDIVHVRVVLDAAPRVVTLDDDAQQALSANPAAAEFWETLSYSNQREFHRWIEDAKRPQTRANRILKSVELLEEGRKASS